MKIMRTELMEMLVSVCYWKKICFRSKETVKIPYYLYTVLVKASHLI